LIGNVSAEAVWGGALDVLERDPTRGFNTAYEVCTKWARREPRRRALTVVDADRSVRQWSYGELDKLAQVCATVFAKAGLRRGDRVAALLSRQVESLIVAVATWSSGLVYVPLYSGLGADAIAHRLRDSGAKLVVVDQRWGEALEAGLSLVSDTPQVITVQGRRDGFWSLLDSTVAHAEAVDTRGGDAATLMFTSGTTGPAKACTMPHNGLVALIPFVQHGLGLSRAASRLFTTADPGWSYGLYSTGVVPMALGIERVMYSGDFDPEAWLDIIESQEVTAIASAPSAYRRLAAELDPRRVAASLTTAASGGEPLLADTARQWTGGGGPPILDAYGLSEVGIVLGDTANPPSGTNPGSIAGPMPGFDVRIVDSDGETMKPGETGRIAIARPPFQLAVDYENNPAAWKDRWVGDLFLTEDMAVIGGDGRWKFVGRADDMIITQGFNVSPVEVETAISGLPEVAEAAVIPGQIPGRGTVVRAVVVLNPGAGSASDVQAKIRGVVMERVARYAAPRIVDFVSALPRTEAGKLKRSSLTSNRQTVNVAGHDQLSTQSDRGAHT
jgi:acetyl-CoA synthetase